MSHPYQSLKQIHTFNYQAIEHHEKHIVPRRRSQLFQQDLTKKKHAIH